MYERNSRQIAFHDEPHMFGGLPLKSDNRWGPHPATGIIAKVNPCLQRESPEN